MAGEYHEPPSELSVETREVHRAICSLIEELEAVDWYNIRADVTADDDLRAILIHNRDEEIEHAAMALEWIRRRVPKLDEELRTYLFTSGPVTEIEEGGHGAETGESAGGRDLGIGSLRKEDA